MRRAWPTLALLALLLSSALPAAAAPAAQGGSTSGTWGTPGDLYLEWTLGGAAIKLKEGYQDSYLGTWGGGPVTLSGTLTMVRAKGSTSWVSLEASVGDQKLLWPAEGGMVEVEGRSESRSFNLSYQVPAGYTAASVPARIRVDYCGQACSNYVVTFDVVLAAEPGAGVDGGAAAEPLTTRPGDDVSVKVRPCTEATPAQKRDKILALYYKTIPRGPARSGELNNVMAVIMKRYEQFKCGGYQARVLALLDGLRFSTDPCDRTLVDDWDYGPIQAFWGGHQAVVLYPRGTEWLMTGIVLDPWLEQEPKVYSVRSWGIWMGGPQFVGVGGSGTYTGKVPEYPTVGGGYNPRGDSKLTDEEQRFVDSLPPEKQKAFGGMQQNDPWTAKRWVRNAIAGRGPRRQVVAHCPLHLYLVGPDGARSGFPGGDAVFELADVSLLRMPLSDGTYWTEVEYPEGAGYTLILEGTGRGQAFVLAGDGATLEPEPGPAYEYAFEAEAGRTYRLSTDSLGQPLTSDGMALQPTLLTQGSEPDWVDRLPSLASVPEYGAGEAASAKPLGRWLLPGGGAALALVLAAGSVFLLRRRSRRGRRAALPPAPVPVARPPAVALAGQANCPTCGAPLKPGIKFCGSCGAAVPQAPAACPGCGQPVNPGARFCGSCGQALGMG